jgi:hypothetical protein
MVQFLQEVALLWSFALRQEMYDGRSVMDSLLEGSLHEDVELIEHMWLDESVCTEGVLHSHREWQEVPDVEQDEYMPEWLTRYLCQRGVTDLVHNSKWNGLA